MLDETSKDEKKIANGKFLAWKFCLGNNFSTPVMSV